MYFSSGSGRPKRNNTLQSASHLWWPSRLEESPTHWRGLFPMDSKRELGQPVVVENRPGAGGNIAAGAVSGVPPDGYTLLLTTTALAINLTLHRNNQFTVDDFKTVAIVASSPEALLVNPSNHAQNLADFVNSAKGRSINFGSAGVGSGSHIEAEYFFKKIANISAVHIPFQGGAPAINALLRQSNRRIGNNSRRWRSRTDECGQAQGPRYSERQTGGGRRKCPNVCRTGLSSISSGFLGRSICTIENRWRGYKRINSMLRFRKSLKTLGCKNSSRPWASIQSLIHRQMPTPFSRPK